ncbi:aldo/keto reductase [Christiangramia aquimixticola]|uniref:aldo/keto reductase n=1 Tax=Christiangramia aquimixticola TaxID=1697558 RepID=UPI003AA86C5C
MIKKQLGSTDLYTPPIVFGGNVIGWTLNEKESFRMLDEILELGFNVIDTADVYSRWAPGNPGGESERILGKWMKERNVRDRICLITKGGSSMQQGGPADISPSYLLKATEDSLKRLQTDYIDLYFTHKDDNQTPVEETLEAYQQLIKEGKVRYIGASNLSAERLQASLEASRNNSLPKYEVFQPEYSLVERQKFEKDIREICLKNKLGVISYFSLASGFLTGKYKYQNDITGNERERFLKNYATEKSFKILKVLEEVAHNHNISQAGAALAWILKKPGITAPIASATKLSHLQSFREAIEVKLTSEEMNLLDKVSD